jgi:hypothetical protein
MSKKLQHILYLLVLFVLVSSLLQGQVPKKGVFRMEYHGFSGYHFATDKVNSTGQSLSGWTFGLEAGIRKSGGGSEKYREKYGDQDWLLSARIIKMNNVDTFGWAIGILPTCFIPIIRKEDWQIQAKVSFGVNFNTLRFDAVNNADNRAISSPINFAVDMGLESDIKIGKKHCLVLGTGLYHISNGSLKRPNGGINIVYGKIGFRPAKGFGAKPNYSLENPAFFYQSYLSFSNLEQGDYNTAQRFWAFTYSNQVQRQVNQLYSIGLGLDAFYDASQAIVYEYRPYSSVPEHEKFLVAVGIAQQFTLGEIFIPVGFYRYVYAAVPITDPNYLRFGLGWYITKHLFIGSFFKGTVNKKFQLNSNFMEWSIGFRW